MTPTRPVDRKSRSLVGWLMHKSWRWTRAHTIGGQVCVVDGSGAVLLVRHGYRAGWHFPGGGVEYGETIADGALRELAEETGVIATGDPVLHGIFNHHAEHPGDQIALFVLRNFQRPQIPAPTLEIAEQGFYRPDALPDGTSGGTQRRISELFEGRPISRLW